MARSRTTTLLLLPLALRALCREDRPRCHFLLLVVLVVLVVLLLLLRLPLVGAAGAAGAARAVPLPPPVLLLLRRLRHHRPSLRRLLLQLVLLLALQLLLSPTGLAVSVGAAAVEPCARCCYRRLLVMGTEVVALQRRPRRQRQRQTRPVDAAAGVAV
jgi:hypothetical protein